MAPFHYESSVDPRQSATIADLMLRRGDIAAHAAQQNGAVWNGAAQNIGQMIGALPGQIALGKRAELQDKIGALQLQGAQQAAGDDQRLRAAYQQSGGDPAQMRALLASSGGLTLQHDQTLQAMEQQKKAHEDDMTTSIGLQLHQQINPNDPTGTLAAMQTALNAAEKHGLISSEQAQQFGAMASADPSKIPDVAKAWIAASPRGQALLEKKTILKEGEKGFGFDDRPLPGMEIPAKENEVELAKRAAAGDPLAIEAMNRLKPAQNRTAEQDDARYRDIAAKQLQKQPISPEDAAWAKGYEQQKTLGVDKSAGAAADRQTAAIGSQVAQQKRAQDFAALQAARADLEKNVNTPYNTAKTSANTLRDVVEAAKNGNTVAASLQALEGTMAAIRSQGLNRINTAEIGATANAGSLFQNIAGWVGKKAEGQPVPASVQKDMLEFASILEKAAHKKYQAGHKAVNALYGTNIPELLTGPEESPAAAPTLTPGLAGLAGRK